MVAASVIGHRISQQQFQHQAITADSITGQNLRPFFRAGQGPVPDLDRCQLADEPAVTGAAPYGHGGGGIIRVDSRCGAVGGAESLRDTVHLNRYRVGGEIAAAGVIERHHDVVPVAIGDRAAAADGLATDIHGDGAIIAFGVEPPLLTIAGTAEAEDGLVALRAVLNQPEADAACARLGHAAIPRESQFLAGRKIQPAAGKEAPVGGDGAYPAPRAGDDLCPVCACNRTPDALKRCQAIVPEFGDGPRLNAAAQKEIIG